MLVPLVRRVTLVPQALRAFKVTSAPQVPRDRRVSRA
jgi:hypothetical protein